MKQILLITVRFHDGRYHGTGDWPPSPARLFQAIVAGIGQDGPLSDVASKPLEWLEGLDPPIIATPLMIEGKAVTNYVPNNELDSVGGDVLRIGSIRAAKVWKPKLFDQRSRFQYAWHFEDTGDGRACADRICVFVDRLYQLGRGIDQAWGTGEIVDPENLEAILIANGGVVHKPTNGSTGTSLACPQRGSVTSLKERYGSTSRRFSTQRQGRGVKLHFTQAPKPRFTSVVYDSPPIRKIFELRSQRSQTEFNAWPLSRVGNLVVAIRDGAVARLKSNLPELEVLIEKSLVGRKANGDNDVSKSARVRIIPLPSIGHAHADNAVRRILVEIPAGCLMRSDDILWAFSGLELNDVEFPLSVLGHRRSHRARLNCRAELLQSPIPWRLDWKNRDANRDSARRAFDLPYDKISRICRENGQPPAPRERWSDSLTPFGSVIRSMNVDETDAG